ncbi:MAG: hypothetical protein GXO32_00025 [Crenarchaeota archaeon]|nr:hypothetical protein [Thermoproteota archaeon]
MSVELVERAIRSYASSRDPEALEELERACREKLGCSLAKALVERPRELRDYLLKINDRRGAEFVARELLIKPVARSLGMESQVELLTKLFMEYPEEFGSVIKKITASASQRSAASENHL